MSADNRKRAGSASLPNGGKVARLSRTRLACTACHRAKQRCEGPSVCPCHRCVTYGVECIFPGVTASGASEASSSVMTDSTPSAPPSQSVLGSDSLALELAGQLRTVTARLESIESRLDRAQISFPPSQHSQPPTEPSPLPTASPLPTTSPVPNLNAPSPKASFSIAEFRRGNPLETAAEAMAVESLVDMWGGERDEESWSAMIKPDVLSRRLLTMAEVESEFDLFYRQIHPWAALLSLQTDQDPLAVRDRSPILFHAILLITAYYRPRTPSNILLYRAISSILDSILSPIILCAQPEQLNADLARALYLLLLYKPVQYASLSSQGIADPAAAEHASKMNVQGSWLLRMLCVKVSAYISPPSCTSTFAQHFANHPFEEIPEGVIQDQRLYFSSIWRSLHGALQGGSAIELVPQEVLKTTRSFATLRQQPSDPRLAAGVEMAATAAALFHSRKEDDRIDPIDLAKFNHSMEEWHDYWVPLLTDLKNEDELWYTAQFPYANFCILVINGFSYTRWKGEKKQFNRTGGASGGLEPPVLTTEDLDAIKIAVSAAEGLILALTVEGRSELASKSNREDVWAEGGLTLDEIVVHRLRWASDSVTSVVYSYALIFLAKLANDSIIHSDLRFTPPPSTSLGFTRPDPTDKLWRLLLLGADFLDMLAPSPHHPAVKQAKFLRRIRDAGLKGGLGVVSAPGSPRLNPASSSHLPSPPISTNQNGISPSYNSYSTTFSSTLFEPPPGSVEDAFSAMLAGVDPSVLGSTGFFGSGWEDDF